MLTDFDVDDFICFRSIFREHVFKLITYHCCCIVDQKTIEAICKYALILSPGARLAFQQKTMEEIKNAN